MTNIQTKLVDVEEAAPDAALVREELARIAEKMGHARRTLKRAHDDLDEATLLLLRLTGSDDLPF